MIENTNIKIIYIAGYGRSGTTLMSIALGSHPSIFGAGEVTEFSRHAWINNTHCSCGEPLQQCAFWSAIAGSWLPADQSPALTEYAKLQRHFENIVTMKTMELGLGRKGEFEKYLRETEKLFRAIVSRSGKNIVVDSSKLPSRARALARINGIQLYVVHMVRDGRGVAWSLMKGYKRDVKAGLQRELVPKSYIRTGIRWVTVNLAAEHLRQVVGSDRYLRIRYEDFVSEPVATLKRVGDMIGCDFHDVATNLAGGQPIESHHQMAGNRLRMNATIRMERDEAWRSQMPESKRRGFERLFGRFLSRYSYT